MWPVKKRFGRARAKWKRVARAAFSEYRRAKEQVADRKSSLFGTISLSDISHGLARRYRCELSTIASTHAEIEESLPEIVNNIRGQKVFASEQSRKRWRGASPHYVTGWIYSREKRERDRWADERAQFYVGSFEWRDPDADPENLPLAMTGGDSVPVGDGIVYEPNRLWPPSDIHVPRASSGEA
jgi:hypothetical protein